MRPSWMYDCVCTALPNGFRGPLPPQMANLSPTGKGQPEVAVEVVADDVPSFVTRYPLMAA
jgi:hypothetical protein